MFHSGKLWQQSCRTKHLEEFCSFHSLWSSRSTALWLFRCAAYTYHLIRFKEQHVECQSKCNHQQQSKKCNLQKRLDNIDEHQNIDSCHRPFLKKWYKSNPTQEYRYNTDLPLPVVNTEAGSCKHKCEYHGAQVQGDLQPVDPVLQVLHWVPVQLYYLYYKSQECSCNGEGSTNEEELVLIDIQI